jgi:DNA uptake protein ComE-like DNA-binding protein
MKLLKLLGVMSLGLTLAFAAPPKKEAKKVDAKVDVKKADAKKAAETMDINTATADQLKTIAGIGDAYSAKIIKGRPYKRKDELVQKGILPQGVYDKVKEQIIAKQK